MVTVAQDECLLFSASASEPSFDKLNGTNGLWQLRQRQRNLFPRYFSSKIRRRKGISIIDIYSLKFSKDIRAGQRWVKIYFKSWAYYRLGRRTLKRKIWNFGEGLTMSFTKISMTMPTNIDHGQHLSNLLNRRLFTWIPRNQWDGYQHSFKLQAFSVSWLSSLCSVLARVL